MEKPNGMTSRWISNFFGGSRYSGIYALIFLSVLSSRAWLISAYGSPIPFLDQWEAEALRTYLPWLDGSFRWAQLFSSHNEHRLVFTHLENIALLQATGRWDPLAQQLLNAGWYALASTFLCALVGEIAATRNRAYILTFTALVCIAPFGWQNALWGFQSHTYFAMLLCLSAIAAFTQATLAFRGELLGAAVSLLCILASGSGLILCAGMMSAFIVWGALKFTPWTGIGRPVFMLGLVAVIAWQTTPSAPGHTDLHAKSFVSFLGVLMQCLAWPNIYRPLAAIVAWFPFGWLCIAHQRKSLGTLPVKILIALSGIVALHASAIAYARGAGLPDGAPLSRYQDILAWGAVINFSALFLLRQTVKLPHIKLWRLTTVTWIFFFAIGFIELTAINFRLHLPFKRAADQWQMANLTAYISTRDPGALANKSMYEIGHPSPEVIKAVLDNPRLTKILPTALAAPAAIASGSEIQEQHLILIVRAFVFFALPALICLLVYQVRVEHRLANLKPDANITI